MGRRIGVVGIIIKDRKKTAPYVNNILTEFGDIIIGRMGIPYRERNVSVISLLVDATTDEIGALTGKLGKIENVLVKSTLMKI